jgi:hypothetical protein
MEMFLFEVDFIAKCDTLSSRWNVDGASPDGPCFGGIGPSALGLDESGCLCKRAVYGTFEKADQGIKFGQNRHQKVWFCIPEFHLDPESDLSPSPLLKKARPARENSQHGPRAWIRALTAAAGGGETGFLEAI